MNNSDTRLAHKHEIIKLQSMDGLRGFALLLVLTSHMGHGDIDLLIFPNLMGLGKTGVAIFFVLSSFLLYRQWLNKPRVEVMSWRNWAKFMVRRIFRIYPAYTVILLIFFSLAREGQMYFSEGDLLRHLLLVEGFRHLWAIPAEFGFYLALPFIVIALFSFTKGRGSRAFILVSLMLLSIFYHVNFSEKAPVENAISMFSYLEIFLTGMICAELENWISMKVALANSSVIVGFLVVILTIPSIMSILVHRPVAYNEFHHYTWIYCLIGFLLVSGCMVESKLVSAIFGSKTLCWIGKVSFSAYLFHPLFLHLVKMDLVPVFLKAFLFLSVTFFIAYISFFMIERPGIRLGESLNRKMFSC